MTLSAGDRVAHYRIVERIGAGGMGEVYKAVDLRLDRCAALKLLPPHLTADDERVRRFVREAKSASALTHPNIVTIYDTDRTAAGGSTTWYIAMELVEGETLRARLHRDRIDLATAATLVAQIADALAKAHAHGIVHRDLKPENIMVTSDGFAKVLDFGLAKLVESKHAALPDSEKTADGVIVGTISYMSPEQIRGDEVDARSDLFSLGCILYELVARRRAYAAPPPMESLHRTIYDEPQQLSGVPAELQRIIDRCLRKLPVERYQSAKELASDLRRFARRIEQQSEPAPLSIAVLPFRDLTGSQENAHIGLGLADAIITELAASRKLLVRPTAVIVAYRDRATDPSTAGRELGVDAVVDGAFQRSGARLRVTVQLISTEGARSLWATKIDSSLDDLFAMQDEVARRISESLSVEIAPPAARATRAPQPVASAYESYMKGKLALCFETIEKIREAIDAFQHATAADPGFAPGWAGLADAYMRLNFNWDPSGDWYRKAVEASERALSIDAYLPEAHYIQGRIVWSPQGNFDHARAIREYASALRLNPNLSEAHGRLGLVLLHVGLIGESEDELRQTLTINPMDSVADGHLATCRFLSGEWSECLDLLEERIARTPHAWLYYIKTHVLLRLDRDSEAVQCCDQAALLFPESAFYFPLRALLAAKALDRTRATEQIARTIEHQKMYGHYHHAQYDIACAYALLGNTDEAIQWARDAARNGFPNAPLLERDPLLASARGPALDALIAGVRGEAQQYRQLYDTLVRSVGDQATTVRLT